LEKLTGRDALVLGVREGDGQVVGREHAVERVHEGLDLCVYA